MWQHATGWLSPLEYDLGKTNASVPAMSALWRPQSVRCGQTAASVPSQRHCSEPAATVSFVGHGCGCARSCNCCAACAAVFGVDASLLVFENRSVSVAGVALAAWFRCQHVDCMSGIQVDVFNVSGV